MNFLPHIAKQLLPFPGEPFVLKLKKPDAAQAIAALLDC